MNDTTTWGNLNVLVREPKRYVSPEELQFMERVAVGRICRCGECMCCEDYMAHMAERERIARAVKHTVVCMHKSNYVPVAKGDRETLKQLTRPGRGLEG